MDVTEYLQTLRKRWLTILGVTALVLLATAGGTLLSTPEFTARTRLFFAVPTGESVSDLAQGSSFTERQMSSYAQVATSPLVLEPVIDQLDLDVTASELAGSVSATVPLNTVILEVAATHTDPAQAARIANAVGARLSGVVATLYPERPGGAQAVLATTLTPARPPTAPASPNVRRNLLLGLVLGLAGGVGAALIRERLDTKIRSERDVAQVTERSLLGSVVFDPAAPEHPIVMQDDPHSQRAESIRRLRTNLQFVDVDSGPRSILVTSSVPSEGKTTTVVNLAVALADAGSRVLLVDADLRRPSVAPVMGLEGSAGLTTVLIGQAGLQDVVQPWRDGKLDVLTSGPVPPNPSELLGSAAMAGLLRDLTATYDVVLLDSPPLLPVTDAAILSRRAGGTLVVVGTDRIHKAELHEALGALEAVDAHVVGLVLNKVAQREFSAYASGYSYGYSPKPTHDTPSIASADGRSGPAGEAGAGADDSGGPDDRDEANRDRGRAPVDPAQAPGEQQKAAAVERSPRAPARRSGTLRRVVTGKQTL